MQVGSKAIVRYTHGHNGSNPIWTVSRISPSGKQMMLTNEHGHTQKVTLRGKGEEAYYGCVGDNYTVIEFEGSEWYNRIAMKDEPEVAEESSELMSYALTDVVEALETLVEKLDKEESLTFGDYIKAKNAIAYAHGLPLPFVDEKRMGDAVKILEKAYRAKT